MRGLTCTFALLSLHEITPAEMRVAFLCTFVGLTFGGMAWMAIWAGCNESNNSVLNVAAMWLSPMTVTGWLSFVVLSLICSLLTYRLMRPSASEP